jgi:uncharacterized protein YoaH (UPF0181 family)
MKRKVTKASRIRKLLAKGMTAGEIAKAVPSTTRQDVWVLKYRDKRKDKKYLPKPVPAVYVATPEEEEAIKEIVEKHKSANTVQIGGEHYKRHDIQPWDAVHAWGLGFFDGNVIKYVARHSEKNGIEDLKKARHYLDKLIELMEKGK